MFIDAKTIEGMRMVVDDCGNRKFRDSTIKTYDGSIQRIYKFMGYDEYNENIIINNYTNVIDCITKNIKIQKQGNMLYAIIGVLKAINKIDSDAYRAYLPLAKTKCNESIDFYTYKKADENEVKITQDELLDKHNEMRDIANNNTEMISAQIRYLVSGLYALLPPLRNQDYCEASLLDANHINYLDMVKWTLTIKEGKNLSLNDKPRIVQIPSELIEVIKIVYDRVKSKWLIPMITDINQNMKTDAFRHFMHKLYNAKLSPSKLRNNYISQMNDANASAIERKDTAKIMGHTVKVQQTIYTKHSEILHPEVEEVDEEDELDEAYEIDKLEKQIEANNALIIKLTKIKALKAQLKEQETLIKSLRDDI